MNGIWALKPYYLGPWTLSASEPEADSSCTRPEATSTTQDLFFLGGFRIFRGLGFRVLGGVRI